MKLPMPVTREKIRNHFHYSLWKYVLLVVVSFFFWNLLFTTTRYRTPDFRKVEFFAEGYQSEEAAARLNSLLGELHERVLPDMEEVSGTVVTLDSTYGPMQLTVWASAGQGDIYLLTRQYFLQLAQSGALANLRPFIDSGALNAEGFDLTGGMVRDEQTGESVLCGIPAEGLSGLTAYGLADRDSYFGVLVTGGNTEESVLLLSELLACFREAPET